MALLRFLEELDGIVCGLGASQTTLAAEGQYSDHKKCSKGIS